MLGPATVQLIDTYDPIRGTRLAAEGGRPLWGVRLDSGDFLSLSREMRGILDQAGLPDAKIMVSGDLDEYRIRDLVAAGAPIDAFGVGTQLATSGDAPSMSAIYKMVEVDICGIKRFTAKYSDDKSSLPGAKQVFRFADRDVLARCGECAQAQALVRPVILDGRLVEPLPDVKAARERAAEGLRALTPCVRALEPKGVWPVEHSQELARADRTDAAQPGRGMPDMKTVFFDIDTQIDFMYPAGALYVPGAERIVPAIAQLNRHAAGRGFPRGVRHGRARGERPRVQGVAAALRGRHARAAQAARDAARKARGGALASGERAGGGRAADHLREADAQPVREPEHRAPARGARRPMRMWSTAW